jgi:hypothetical protein
LRLQAKVLWFYILTFAFGSEAAFAFAASCYSETGLLALAS